jgi:integrase
MLKPRVFLPWRKRNGKRVRDTVYHGRYRLDGDASPTQVSLRTTDRRVAESKLRAIVEEAERERAGILPPKLMRESVARPLRDHLDEYVADLRARGRVKRYWNPVRYRVLKLIEVCRWSTSRDVSTDSFVTWRARQADLAAKTLNEYLAAARGLLNWMVRHGRAPLNPLSSVGRVDTRGRETIRRRALTVDQMRALLAAAPERRAVYLVAAQTGLRRGELAALRWSDVVLDGEDPVVNVRASTAKNRKAAALALAPEVVTELRRLQAVARRDRPVFDRMVPKMPTFKADLERAGVPFIDSEGRRVDFHALRHTLGTNLSRAGVPLRVAMELMRHSDPGLTMKTYTDVAKLPLREAVNALPRFMGDVADVEGVATRAKRDGGTRKRSPLAVQTGHARSRRGRSDTHRRENPSRGEVVSSAGAGTPSHNETERIEECRRRESNPHAL